MFSVELSQQAEKDLAKVFRADRKLYQRFVAALQTIARDPLEAGKPLHGELKELRSHRFGSYRILYEILHGRLIVIVVDLGHRREIYG